MGGKSVYEKGQNSKRMNRSHKIWVANSIIIMKSTTRIDVKTASFNFILFMDYGTIWCGLFGLCLPPDGTWDARYADIRY